MSKTDGLINLDGIISINDFNAHQCVLGICQSTGLLVLECISVARNNYLELFRHKPGHPDLVLVSDLNHES